MAEDLQILENASKKERYDLLIRQLDAMVKDEPNLIANLANICAGIKETFHFLWVGCYFIDSEDELVLGPFQGPVACTRIKKGKGVCGTSWAKESTIIVPEVEAFPGHIACSSLSRSEIVLPLYHHHQLIGVLDIDSANLSEFDETDQHYLEKITRLL